MDIDYPDYIDDKTRGNLHSIVDAVIDRLPERPNRSFFSTDSSERAPSYFSIWLFTPQLAVKIRNSFVQSRVQYEMARIRDVVDWVRLSAREFNLSQPTKDSQLDLEFTTTDGASGELSAKGEKCSDLMDLYEERFRPSFAAFANIEKQASED